MGSKTIEGMVKEVGSFGRFQFLLLFLCRGCVPMATWSTLFMVFGAVEPDWWCESHDLHNTSTVHFLNNSLRDAVDAEADFNFSAPASVLRDEYALINEEGLRFDNSSSKSCIVPNASGAVCEKIVFASGMNTLVSQFQLVCGLSWVPPMIISLQMVGVLIGACVSGIACDGIGRKKTIVTLIVLHAVFNLISAFSFSWEMFAVTRTLVGITTGGIFTTAYGYPTEFIGQKWRALIGSIPYWGIGSLSYSLLVWVLPDWSYQHFVTAACTAACLPAWLFLPESVRWLSVKGRMTEAHAVLVKMAKWNRRTPPTLQSMQELCVDSDSTQKKYHYFHLFASWKLLKLSVLHGWLWFSCSLTYYGISFGIKDMSGNFYMNFILMSAFEIWPPLFVYPLSKCLGRRWTVFGSLLITTLSTLAVVPISLLMSADESGTYINALCTGARAAHNLLASIISVYMAEQYPTVVRNIALGYANTITRLGGILAPYILSLGEPYLFYAIVSGVMVVACITPLLMPETKGRPLSDELPPSCWQRQSDRIPGDKKEFELVKTTEM